MNKVALMTAVLAAQRRLSEFAFSSATAGQATSRLRPGRGRAEWSLNFRANGDIFSRSNSLSRCDKISLKIECDIVSVAG
jgi:hypothetical protein